ncbi:hypothetical protein [Streptomyces luteogriseus]|uniref:hypothetical protein n=1 Tax=Streptomyces luteogriseus TaxID=68233 RepID=UPI00367A0EED
MRATQRDLAENFGHETKLLTRDELRSELGSDHYQSALLDPLSAALHVGKYVHGLAEAAERARFAPSDPASDIKSGDILKREMTEIFPQLAGVRIDYVWGGAAWSASPGTASRTRARPTASPAPWVTAATASRWPPPWAARSPR